MVTSYIGTTDGVYRYRDGTLTQRGLCGQRIWAIHAFRDTSDDEVVLAGSYGDGLFRSTDAGESWQAANDGLSAAAFRVIVPDPLEAGAILAGTEPGRLFRSRDGGQTWSELAGITEIEGHGEWYLPYSPRAGAVRNIYAPRADGDTLFASVEVGGLLVSHDRGATWACDAVGIDDDIHHITGHPADPDLLFVSLGYASLRDRPRQVDGQRFGGIARSRDGGASWEKLERDYTRATLIPPGHPDLLLAGPAPNVGAQGRIVVSHDQGDSWQPASDGIDTPMPDMVELFLPTPDGDVWAICSGGRLLAATPGEWHWTSVVPEDAGMEVQSVGFVG